MSVDPMTYARLREIAEQLPQVPGIGTIEIADGEIIMMISPVRRHELAVFRIARQLNAQLPKTHPGFIAHPGAELEDVGLGRLRRPDLMVFAEATLEGDQPAVYPHEVVLVVEVVSRSNPSNDYDSVALFGLVDQAASWWASWESRLVRGRWASAAQWASSRMRLIAAAE